MIIILKKCIKKIYLLHIIGMKIFGSIFFVVLAFSIYSQPKVEGRVVQKADSEPIENIEVRLIAPNLEFRSKTNELGVFSFSKLNSGNYTIVISSSEFAEQSMDIDYIAGEEKKIEDIALESIGGDQTKNQMDIPLVDQSDDESSNLSNNTVASLLNSSRDVFAFNAFLALGQGGFRPRGFNGQDQVLFINGIPIENILRGNQITFNDYVGLNDVLRSRSSYYGIKPVPFAFGEQTNSMEIDAEAINQRKGLRFSQVLSNRNFISRTALTYNTGLLKNNMAFSGSISFRGASEGYIPGTSMQTISGFVSVSKKWSQRLVSSISALYTDNLRAVSKAATKEFYNLAGTNYYNPNWGLDGSQKRSASLRRDNVPIFIVSNDFKLSEATSISISGSYQFGRRYVEKLDWYNSFSPEPTYYRNAPSYFIDDMTLYNETYNDFINHKNLLQVDWARLRDVNSSNIETVPTKGLTGKWARYLMYKDVTKINALTLNSVLKHQLNEIVSLQGGLMAQLNTSENYKEASDLLGADFYVNINQFAQRANPSNPDAIHNDLNNPYGIVRVGDKYGYDAIARATNVSGWAQSIFTLRRFDAFLALKAEQVSYSREGLYRTGAFADKSYGKSESKSFMNFNIKGGFTYKHDGKNYISLNLARQSLAPLFGQVFILPRTTNIINPNAVSSAITTAEVTYTRRGARTRVSIAGYYTQSEKESEVKSFYTELSNSFGSLVLSDMSKRYMGVEFAAESKIGNSGLTLLGLSSIGDFSYSNRPKVAFYYDNNDQITPEETVYFQGLHLPTGPQIAGLLKVSYNSKQFWMASLGLNYFDKIYVEPSPQRRTVEAVDNVDPNSELYSKILTQEHLPSAFTLDAYFRKSFMINKYIKSMKKRMYLDLNVSVSNILDYQNYASSGFEQLRFDFRDNNPDKFPNRYFYMMGRTYSLNLVFRM